MHIPRSSLNACLQTLAKDKPASPLETSSSTRDASQAWASLRSPDLLTEHSQHNDASGHESLAKVKKTQSSLQLLLFFRFAGIPLPLAPPLLPPPPFRVAASASALSS